MASEEELKRDIERLRAEIESPNVSAEEALIDDVRRELTAQNEQIPWFLQSFVSPPTDPLTVCLLALVEDLPANTRTEDCRAGKLFPSLRCIHEARLGGFRRSV